VELLPAEVGHHPGFAGIARIEDSPIISMHLWFSRSFVRHDAVGVIGRRIQWVFRKEHHLSVTISAARDMVAWSNTHLVKTAVEDLRTIYGEEIPEPDRTLVIREKRATFSCSPQAELLRPAQRTPLQNLFLAGDWTDTGLPATIEGAVVSGKRASELVAEGWGRGR
jgi:predicted NAD/FAD-dependent oxidoreductase